jgi:Holliday junction DNA helicase RuvB
MNVEEQYILYDQIVLGFYIVLSVLVISCGLIGISSIRKTDKKTKKEIVPTYDHTDVFKDFVGNERVVCILQTYLFARKTPNLLFSGPRSVGKTELAKRYAKAKGCHFVTLDKSSLTPAQFKRILLDLPAEQPILFFIDEVHALPPGTQDMLLTACEPSDRKITLFGTIFDLKRCSFIAATTNIGKLSQALQSRFVILEMEEYTESDIAEILMWKIPGASDILTHSFLKDIAKLSKLVPRIAISGCEYVMALIESNPDYNEIELLEELKKYFDCNDNGLTKQDLEYLKIVETLQPVSSSTLCAMLCVDKDTLENNVEPFLLRNKLIKRTNKGRCLYA